MREDALIKACKLAGSRVELAKNLAIKPTTINNWVNAGVGVPLQKAMDIEVSVKGQVTAENITPHAAASLRKYKKFCKTKWWEDIIGRIKKIKHERFKNTKLIKAEKKIKIPFRLIFIGLLMCCDHEGRFSWQPTQLKMEILPDEDNVDFEVILNAFSSLGLIKKYEVGGKYYGCFSCLETHQVNQCEENINGG